MEMARITANDPVSEKALQMVIRMYHTGKELLKVQFYQIIGQVIFYLLIVLGQIMTIMRMILRFTSRVGTQI